MRYVYAHHKRGTDKTVVQVTWCGKVGLLLQGPDLHDHADLKAQGWCKCGEE
jgi:hypothetical protein